MHLGPSTKRIKAGTRQKTFFSLRLQIPTLPAPEMLFVLFSLGEGRTALVPALSNLSLPALLELVPTAILSLVHANAPMLLHPDQHLCHILIFDDGSSVPLPLHCRLPQTVDRGQWP